MKVLRLTRKILTVAESSSILTQLSHSTKGEVMQRSCPMIGGDAVHLSLFDLYLAYANWYQMQLAWDVLLSLFSRV